MSTSPIVVRYWAAARTAAGVGQDELAADGPLTLSEVVRRADVTGTPGAGVSGCRITNPEKDPP